MTWYSPTLEGFRMTIRGVGNWISAVVGWYGWWDDWSVRWYRGEIRQCGLLWGKSPVRWFDWVDWVLAELSLKACRDDTFNHEESLFLRVADARLCATAIRTWLHDNLCPGWKRRWRSVLLVVSVSPFVPENADPSQPSGLNIVQLYMAHTTSPDSSIIFSTYATQTTFPW